MRSRSNAGNRKQKAKRLGIACFLFSAFCFVLLTCRKETGDPPRDSSPKFTQYYNQGEQLYLKYCSNCHQKNGTGLGRVYPPLNTSDFMQHNVNEVICLI